MGISNCCVFGKYEGLYFIDYDDIHVFRHKDCDPDGSAEARFLRDLDYGELTGGDWIFDDLATQFVQQEILDSFTSDFLRMFPNFSKTCPDLWISRSQKAILESPLFYLCLEDSFQRIQSRLFDLTEDAPPTLHFAVMAEQLHSGLVEQIEQFLKEHPATGLVVIDTLQRIRTMNNDATPYANDYRDIGVLKALADRHRIAVLLIHHLRKLNDDDPMNMISGTTGLSGATDSSFVLRKSNGDRLICLRRADGVDDPLQRASPSTLWRPPQPLCGTFPSDRAVSPSLAERPPSAPKLPGNGESEGGRRSSPPIA